MSLNLLLVGISQRSIVGVSQRNVRQGSKFHSERRGILDHGANYAQKTQPDAHGNRILWGWIPEKRPDPDLIAAGWAGCMALP